MFLLTVSSVAFANDKKPIERIAFGSDADQNKPQPIWDAIFSFNPELFLFLGDNVQMDASDENKMRLEYKKFADVSGYKTLLAKNIPVMETWDDHDYGTEDGGADFVGKEKSKEIFLNFFNEPPDSPRRTREGIYDSKIFGPFGKQIQIIALDTRYSRSPLKRGKNGYIPNYDPSAVFLGEEQWQWLEGELRKPAQIRIIMSSIQVISREHGWEKWNNFPLERERLFKLIRSAKAGGVVFISGDRHVAELSAMDAGVGYPLYDLTVGSLNSSLRVLSREENSHRIGYQSATENFGLISVVWSEMMSPQITLEIRDVNGHVLIQRKIPLSVLQVGVLPVRDFKG